MFRLFISLKKGSSSSRRMIRVFLNQCIIGEGWADIGLKKPAWFSHHEWAALFPDGIELVYRDDEESDCWWGISCADDDEESEKFINSLRVESTVFY